MFNNHKTITALDIGTDTIKVLVVSKESERKEFEVVSQVSVPCSGVRKGVVVKPLQLAEEIKIAIEEAQLSSNQRISSVVLNVNGSHLSLVPSKGVVAVSRADRKISPEDVTRVIKNAQMIGLSSNKEIIDVFPREFIIDGEKGIKDAVGMKGTRLEAEVFLLCAFSPYLQNLTKAISSAGLQVIDIKASPIAAAESVLTSQQKELGVVVVDIGADTTGMAVFEEENLIHMSVFPIGSRHITNDIAIGFRCDINTAEKIKREYGACTYKRDKREKYKRDKIKLSDSLIFSRKMLIGIIEARVSEIFELVNKELKKISRQKLLPAGVVLVGGGAKLSKIVDLCKKELKLPVRIGKPKGFIGLEEDPIWATACGLVIEAAEIEEVSNIGRGVLDKLRNFFRIFIP
ncbi:cell division protein FtsA [bacterium]|nr:cell division protein FtsA [bacterium]